MSITAWLRAALGGDWARSRGLSGYEWHGTFRDKPVTIAHESRDSGLWVARASGEARSIATAHNLPLLTLRLRERKPPPQERTASG